MSAKEQNQSIEKIRREGESAKKGMGSGTPAKISGVHSGRFHALSDEEDEHNQGFAGLGEHWI